MHLRALRLLTGLHRQILEYFSQIVVAFRIKKERFFLDATATGKVPQTKSVEEILKTVEAGLYDQLRSLPLLFSPSKQTHMARAKVQKAQHFAQMDMRFDLEGVWRMLKLSFGRRVLLKIILPAGSNDLFSNYLQNKDLTEQFVIPDEPSNS